jgi:hypothetical protein
LIATCPTRHVVAAVREQIHHRTSTGAFKQTEQPDRTTVTLTRRQLTSYALDRPERA